METIIIASLATIGALSLLAICILVILLVLRHSRRHNKHNKQEDLEAGQDKVTATLVKTENIVVISDQSYYCMIGCPASDTDSQADTSDEDTTTSITSTDDSSEDSSSFDEQNMTYTVKKGEDLEKSIKTSKVVLMKENETKVFREKNQNNLDSSIRSLNLSQMFRETEQNSPKVKPEEEIGQDPMERFKGGSGPPKWVQSMAKWAWAKKVSPFQVGRALGKCATLKALQGFVERRQNVDKDE